MARGEDDDSDGDEEDDDSDDREDHEGDEDGEGMRIRWVHPTLLLFLLRMWFWQGPGGAGRLKMFPV
jgi:hypothetical protein